MQSFAGVSVTRKPITKVTTVVTIGVQDFDAADVLAVLEDLGRTSAISGMEVDNHALGAALVEIGVAQTNTQRQVYRWEKYEAFLHFVRQQVQTFDNSFPTSQPPSVLRG